jgi:hypothetical protein
MNEWIGELPDFLKGYQPSPFIEKRIREEINAGRFDRANKLILLSAFYSGYVETPEPEQQDQIDDYDYNSCINYYDLIYKKEMDRFISYEGDKTMLVTASNGKIDLNTEDPKEVEIINSDMKDGYIDARRKNRVKKLSRIFGRKVGKVIGNFITFIERSLFKGYRKSNE